MRACNPHADARRRTIIGSEVALRWTDGRETYYPADHLRAASPSAETQGERDIFGQQHGGHGPRDFFRGFGRQLGADWKLRIAALTLATVTAPGLYSYEYLLEAGRPAVAAGCS